MPDDGVASNIRDAFRRARAARARFKEMRSHEVAMDGYKMSAIQTKAREIGPPYKSAMQLVSRFPVTRTTHDWIGPEQSHRALARLSNPPRFHRAART